MSDLKSFLQNKLCNIISSWCEDDIYAISFFVSYNESYQYDGYSNLTEFSVSYNTERDCAGADELSEKRWNYAFWRQNEVPIIEYNSKNEGAKILFDWYEKNNIKNIGYEDYSSCYDRDMNYIGKGPVGFFELLSEITAIAKNLQDSGFIRNKFGKAIPIIIHDLEYAWYVIDATKEANPNGEADIFLKAIKLLNII